MTLFHMTYTCATRIYYTLLFLILFQMCQSRTHHTRTNGNDLTSSHHHHHHHHNRRSYTQQQIDEIIDPLQQQEEGDLEDSFDNNDGNNNYVRKVKSIFDVPSRSKSTDDPPICPPGTRRVKDDGECVSQAPAVVADEGFLITVLRGKYTTTTTQFMSTRGRGRTRHPKNPNHHRSRRTTTATSEGESKTTHAISSEVDEMDDKVTMIVIDVPANEEESPIDYDLDHDQEIESATIPLHKNQVNTPHGQHWHDHGHEATEVILGRITVTPKFVHNHNHTHEHDSGSTSAAFSNHVLLGCRFRFTNPILVHLLPLLVVLTFYVN